MGLGEFADSPFGTDFGPALGSPACAERAPAGAPNLAAGTMADPPASAALCRKRRRERSFRAVDRSAELIGSAALFSGSEESEPVFIAFHQARFESQECPATITRPANLSPARTAVRCSGLHTPSVSLPPVPYPMGSRVPSALQDCRI